VIALVALICVVGVLAISLVIAHAAGGPSRLRHIEVMTDKSQQAKRDAIDMDFLREGYNHQLASGESAALVREIQSASSRRTRDLQHDRAEARRNIIDG
jgi:hypothetical protein